LTLRQILQKGQLCLTGSKFEALKTKYLAVYPNFFFTAETGAMVQGVLDQLQAINFFTVRRQLKGTDIDVADLMRLDAFAAPESGANEIRAFYHEDDEEEEVDDDEAASGVATERSYIKFQQGTYPGLILFGMKAGKDETESAAWAMPAFLALALPFITGTKVVISEMSLPLYSSGRDFLETVIFDAPHPYLDRLLKTKRVRVNQLLPKLRLLSSIYRVNIDTYAKKGRPEWQHLSAISRDICTDALSLFSYLRKQQHTESLYSSDAALYIRIYQNILEEDLSKIQHCVDCYTRFYRGGYQSHSILKPVDIVAKAIINSPLNIEHDDLLWQIRGELKNWLDRVRDRQAAGYAVLWGKDIDEKEEPLIEDFVNTFYGEIFSNLQLTQAVYDIVYDALPAEQRAKMPWDQATVLEAMNTVVPTLLNEDHVVFSLFAGERLQALLQEIMQITNNEERLTAVLTQASAEAKRYAQTYGVDARETKAKK
jgi:CRISPR-associated protein Csc3